MSGPELLLPPPLLVNVHTLPVKKELERFLKNIPQNFNIPNSYTEKNLPYHLKKVLPP